LLQQGRDHTQRRFTLHWGRAGRHAGFQYLDTAIREVTVPEANGVFAHAERLGDPRAGPAGQRQQNGACPVRFAAITRAGERYQGGALFVGCRERRFSGHVMLLRIGDDRESERNAWSTERILHQQFSMRMSHVLSLLVRCRSEASLCLD
jgi:hypothetical protein